jgi:hypothetical protein
MFAFAIEKDFQYQILKSRAGHVKGQLATDSSKTGEGYARI